MNVHILPSIFLTLLTVIVVFEFLYWFLTKRLGVIINVPKPEVCGVFWLLCMVGVFLVSRNLPDIKFMLIGVLIYALHASYCNSFSLSRTKNGTGNFQPPNRPPVKPPEVIQEWTEDEPYNKRNGQTGFVE